MEEIDYKSEFEYIDRDLSWLSFNYRVLQEAKDKDVPLFERIKFLAIYSSNLGEFFRIRMAYHRNLLNLGKKTKKQLDYDPKAFLKKLYTIVNRQLVEFNDIFENEIIPELRLNNINLLSHLEINAKQSEFIESFFTENLLPYVQPVLLIQDRVKPFLNNSELYLTLVLKAKDEDNPPMEYGIVKIPSDHQPRFIQLPSEKGKFDIILLDEIVRHSAKLIFPGYHIINSYSIKLTRDAELYIEDEFSGDLLDKIKKSLVKRNIGPASRLVYDDSMPKRMLDYFLKVLDINRMDLTPEGRYHNNFDFFYFPDFGKMQLKNKELKQLVYKQLQGNDGIFDKLKQKDHLLNFPYHEYESVIQFFEQAAEDPTVTHIKVTQYRVAKRSRIMEALRKAAAEGKNVFIFIEVKARFDEEKNLYWGEEMVKAGVKVRYSFPGLKVHAKTALVIRQEEGKQKMYSYLSTGNFHEQTAKVYSDFGYFTTDEKINREISRFFNFLETAKIPTAGFDQLLVGQFNLKEKLHQFIDEEIRQAQSGNKAEIILKLNNLQDKEMIDHLYRAGQAGVKIRLIVRGICSLIVGKKGLSENIEGIGIIDRYLEHSRVYYFYQGGKEHMFLSSADWMVRNLHFRIEVAFPIVKNEIKDEIMELLEIQWNDNVKARILDEQLKNNYKDPDDNPPIQSQLETYTYLKRKL